MKNRRTGGPENGGKERSGHPDRRSDMGRRDAIKALGAGTVGLGAAYGVTPDLVQRFLQTLSRGQYEYRFFTPPELETIRLLADMIIPRDERSGSATDAGTVEYADFALSESLEPTPQMWREGLAWLDAECGRRFTSRRFVECSFAQRGLVLDAIAWPQRARDDLEEQVAWFNHARDLIGSGFFSSRMGVEDLGYVGNGVNPNWQGAPPQALNELGVSYENWDRRYGGKG